MDATDRDKGLSFYRRITMRITNKIMQNNSLYNINNNKVTENDLNTMMSTGKKITRPSDDPVIAIRALRLRSNVTQLSQYYEKNAKDAESWLDVTKDALSNVTAVLTDCVKQATKGANKDLTVDDMSIIVTQIDALAKEYYSTGNADYAGRYVFTGYRTDTQLSFDKTTTEDYQDINDEFNARDIGDSSRIIGGYKLNSAEIMQDGAEGTLESEIEEKTVGRIRLSYNKLNYISGDENTATIKYREELTQPATSSVASKMEAINLTFTTSADNVTHYASVPVGNFSVESDNIRYTATNNGDGTYSVVGDDGSQTYEMTFSSDGNLIKQSDTVLSGQGPAETKQVATVTYTGDSGVETINLPLLPAIDQTYSIALDGGYTATVNSDGTFTVKSGETNNSDGTVSREIVQVTANGSIHSSYKETEITISGDHIIYPTTDEETIDGYYDDLYSNDTATGAEGVYLNAVTGEVLLNKALTNKLSTLPDIINANTLDIVYDKKEWENGDIRPQNLFSCEYTDSNGKTILYNKGTARHDIAYDVGFAQSVVVNTTADAVFTTDIKRDVDDLNRKIGQLQQLNTTLTTLKKEFETVGDDDKKAEIEKEIAATKKAYSFVREELQKEFEHKITSFQSALDVANIAVTDNGTRSKRLDLINSRLMDQTTTFKTLQSENEDIDLAEAATKLTTAQVTYEASLMATGKISQTSLLNYL